MILHTAKVVHVADSQSLGQSATFYPPDEISSRGILVATLILKKPGELVSEVEEALEILKNSYFQSSQESQLAALREAVEKVAQRHEFEGDLEIVAGVFWDNFAFFCSWNTSQVYVWRQNSLATVLVGRSGEVGSCSGVVQDQDVFVLGTSQTTQYIKLPEMEGFFNSSQNLEELSESVSTYIYNEQSSNLAISLVHIEGEIDESIGEVNEQELYVEPEAPALRSINSSKPPFSFKNLLIKIAQLLPENVKVQNRDPQTSRKTIVLIGIILLTLLSLSIVFGMQQKKTQSNKKVFEEKILQAQTAYQDSLMQKDVNPTQARELFLKARDITDSLSQEFATEPQLQELKAKILNDTPIVLGKVEEQAQTFLDLSLVREGIQATQLVLDSNKLFILDSQGRRVVTVALANKETVVLGGAEKLDQATNIAVVSGRVLVLNEDGISRLRENSVEETITQDSEWGTISQITGFNGNLYAVDSNGSLWRYSDTGSGFGEKSNWLKESIDLSAIQDIYVDGFVWILKKDGAILKLAAGRQDQFRIDGLDGQISNPTAFYSQEDLSNMYILDTSGGRIIELDKQGNYKKEYISSGISEAQDLVVSQDSQKIFLLLPQKILELPLR